MKLRAPAFVRDLPTPVKVVGGLGLGYLAYRAATTETPEQWVTTHRVAGSLVAGGTAALLLGSAAADAGLVRHRNPFA